MSSQCIYKFKNGDICGEPCFSGESFCISHYRELAEKDENHEPKKTGHPNLQEAFRATPPVVSSITQLRDVLGIAIPQLVYGNIEPEVVSVLAKSCLIQAKLIELAELEGKIKKLEEVVSGDARFVGAFPKRLIDDD